MTGSKVRIINFMKKYGSITSMEAFQAFGITRLSARIKELRDMGYGIETVMMESVNKYGEYVRFGKYILKGEPNGNESTGN